MVTRPTVMPTTAMRRASDADDGGDADDGDTQSASAAGDSTNGNDGFALTITDASGAPRSIAGGSGRSRHQRSHMGLAVRSTLRAGR